MGKKNFLFYLRVSLAGAGLTASAILSPTSAEAQRDTVCSANWWAICCKCKTKCLIVKPLPAFGYCRECNLLCPDCNRELGNLDQALEKLKGRNKGLQEAHRAHQKDYAGAQEKLDASMGKTFGERTGDWNLNGLNGSFGKFNGALASVLSDFSGSRIVLKLIPDIISIMQSSGSADAAANEAGTLVDILDYEGVMKGYTTEFFTNASKKMVDEIRRGVPVDQALKNFNRESAFFENYSSNYTKGVKAADFASTLMDLWGLKNTTDALFKDLSDIGDSYTDAVINQNEMDKITSQILKNLALMKCIKETLDSLNSGGLGGGGFSGATRLFAGKMIITVFAPAMSRAMNNLSSGNENILTLTPSYHGTNWQIDTLQLHSAISQLKKLKDLLKIMITSFEKEILPPLVPWIVNRWKELKPASLVKLLQRAKPPLNVFIGKEVSMNSFSKSIDENIRAAVMGYEINYLSDVSNSPGIISTDKNKVGNTTAGTDKWTVTANEKIKGEFGRVNMNFPAGVDWSFDFYTPENKYVTNRSSFSKHQMFYDITPGRYNITLNHVTVENVPVEKGKEVKLKSGFLKLVTNSHWELYNESKEKYYTSGIKPVIFALPVGTYLLNFEGKDHRMVIKDKVTMKFETPIPFLSN